MATLRETIQAQINSNQRVIDTLRAQLNATDPNVQAAMNSDIGALQTLVATWPALFAIGVTKNV